jgi:tRNA threonylcarbamoyladenosine biosynthesis protein TsaE
VHKVYKIVTRSAEETLVLGSALGPSLLPGDVISLSGDLGAGKTVFVRGVARALGVDGRITSPTFTIVHQHWGRYPLVHVDVYRLTSFQEVLDLGFEELLDPQGVMLVEWGEAVGPLLPRRHLEVDIRRPSDAAEFERTLTFRPRGEEWARKLDAMRSVAEALLAAAAPAGLEPAEFVDAAGRGLREPGDAAGRALRDDKGAADKPDADKPDSEI